MEKKKNWLSQSGKDILNNILACSIWDILKILLAPIISGIYAFLSRKWDILGLEARVGKVIAILAYSIILFIILSILENLYRVIKNKWFKRKEKMGIGINKETLEPRQFYTLAYNVEWIVKNANAKEVASFLLKKYTEIARTTEIGNISYITDNIEFFDPDKHGTLAYAMVVHGRKETHSSRYFYIGKIKGTIVNEIKSIEMFIVTVIQGGEKTSRITFDTNIRKLFPVFSRWLEKDLRKSFSIRRSR